MRRTGVIILNFKHFIVFYKLTRTDKIKTKNKDLSKFLWSLWKELTLGWSKRGWNYPEEGFSIPCISNHNPSAASASPGKRGVPEVIEKERFFWFDFTGWWLVDADGEVGWAPALYLEPADEMSDTEVSNVQRFPISKGTYIISQKNNTFYHFFQGTHCFYETMENSTWPTFSKETTADYQSWIGYNQPLVETYPSKSVFESNLF